jgi:nucleotide-binding universal stress UspA family protein
MYGRILFPTDGSEGSDIVLEHAIDLAQRYDATLEGLFVGDQRTYAGMAADIDREQIKEAQASVSEQALERVRSTAEDAGVDVATTHTSGVPAEKIVEVIEEDDVDLVVMGTHGRTGIRRALLGSVAENVIRQSPVPIHLVPVADGE